MKTSKLLLICAALIISGCANAQRKDTIYQTLATNYTSTTPSTGDIWGPVTNIGQGYHQAYLTLSNQTGQVCKIGNSAQALDLSVNFYTKDTVTGLYNSVLTTQIFNTAHAPNLSLLSQATSIFPFIYIKVLGVDPVLCKYNLIYTGSLYPPPPFNQLYNGNNVLFGTGFGTFVSSINTITTNATTSLVTVPSYYERVFIDTYAYVINSSAANQSVSIFCEGGTKLQEFDNLQVGQTVILPFTESAYDLCPYTSTGITAVTTGVTGNLTIKLYYKFE